jgi:predicted dehydrogenase
MLAVTSFQPRTQGVAPGGDERQPIRIGVLGYGYWGPNLARNVAQHPSTVLAAIVDLSPARLASARRAYPGVSLTDDIRGVLDDPGIDAVLIATPPETHHRLVLDALGCGKHVLVEKPLATSVGHAEELVAAAEQAGLVLAVDHTFLFTGAVRWMKRYFDAGEVGDVYYYDSTRINLGLFQHDTNVIWDLAPHDLSIMLHLLDQPVRTVSAFGARHVDMDQENIAYLTLQFDGPLLAHFHVNWLAPTKVRRIIIGGSRKMLVYDDLEPDEKLKVYDSGVQVSTDVEELYGKLVEYRTGDVLSPKTDKTEALATEMTHFVNVIRGLEQPISGGRLGLQVVKILDAAQRSLRAGGTPTAVSA